MPRITGYSRPLMTSMEPSDLKFRSLFSWITHAGPLAGANGTGHFQFGYVRGYMEL